MQLWLNTFSLSEGIGSMIYRIFFKLINLILPYKNCKVSDKIFSIKVLIKSCLKRSLHINFSKKFFILFEEKSEHFVNVLFSNVNKTTDYNSLVEYLKKYR